MIDAAAPGRERMARRAGWVRIALGLLGIGTSVFVPALERYRVEFACYLAIALLFQWIIQRRPIRTITGVVVMGLIDTLFLSFVVQRLGSTSSPLALVYVVVPVLYTTATPRRRIALILAAAGIASYALIVLLEALGVLPYAPAQGGTIPAPDLASRIGYVALVAICAWVTAALASQLISALNTANARLRDLSQHDELTRLYNRRYVMQRLDDELARLRRSGARLSVAMVDLDGFKRVNDLQGHDTGDAVLRAVAGALLSATRKVDVVARYGGDEFVVLLPNTDSEGARALATRILNQTRDAVRAVCPEIPVSASIGTATVGPNDDPLEILRRVDEQLYAAKRSGGDRIE